MKAGIAIQMALLAEYSQKPEELPVNIGFLAVVDEENNSAGMRAAITHLAKLEAVSYTHLDVYKRQLYPFAHLYLHTVSPICLLYTSRCV